MVWRGAFGKRADTGAGIREGKRGGVLGEARLHHSSRTMLCRLISAFEFGPAAVVPFLLPPDHVLLLTVRVAVKTGRFPLVWPTRYNWCR